MSVSTRLGLPRVNAAAEPGFLSPEPAGNADPLTAEPMPIEDRFAFFVAALERQLATVSVTGRG